jgi:hypothetical protein
MEPVLADQWPQYGLTVFTPRLELRLPREEELAERDFLIVREVTTSAWLGIEHQRKGYGTEARIGLLTLAFDHLDALAALTEVFRDNLSSQGVSRKLGYEPDGISRDARGHEAVVSDRLRLTREKWNPEKQPAVTVDGMAACRPMFGL